MSSQIFNGEKWRTFFERSYSLTFANIKIPKFNLEACYKLKVITGYWKDIYREFHTSVIHVGKIILSYALVTLVDMNTLLY